MSRTRRLLTFFVGATALLGLCLVATVSWLRSDDGYRFLAALLSEQVTKNLETGSLHIDDVFWNFDGTISASGMSLFDRQRETVVSLSQVEAKLSVEALLDGAVHLSAVVIDGGFIDLRTNEEGLTRLSGIFPASEESATSWQGLGRVVRIPDILLRNMRFQTGTASTPEEWNLSATGSLDSKGTRLTLDSWDVGVQGPIDIALRGGLVLTDKVLELGKWDVDVKDQVFSASGRVLAPMMEPKAELSLVHVETGAAVNLVATVALQEPQMPMTLSGDVSVDDFGWLGEDGEGFGFVGTVDSSGVLAGDNGPSLKVGVASDVLRVAGYEVEKAALDASLVGNTLTLERLTVGGFGVSIVSSGELDLDSGAAKQSLTGRFDLSKLAAVGLTGVAGDGSVSLGVTGGNGEPWRLSGPVRLDAVRLDNGIVVQDLEGRVDLIARSDAQTTGTVRLRFGEVTMPTLSPTNGEVTLSLVGNDLEFDVYLRDARSEGELLRAKGRIGRESNALSFTELWFAPTEKTVWRSKDQTHVTIDKDGFSGLNARFTSNAGALIAVGGVGENRVLRVIVEGVDLGAVGEIDGDWGLKGGHLNGGVTLKKQGLAYVGEANLMVDQLKVDALLNPVDVAGKVALSADAILINADVNDQVGALSELRASLPVSQETAFKMALDRDVSASVFIFPSATSRLVKVAPESPMVTWKASGELVVSGLLGDPKVSLNMVSAGDVPNWVNGGRLEASVVTSGRTTSVNIDALKGFNPRVRLQGTLQNRLDEWIGDLVNGRETLDDVVSYFAEDLDLNVTVENAPIKDVARFAGVDASVAGRLAGSLVVEGSWWSPTVRGAVNWVDGRMGKVRMDGAVLSVNTVDGGFDTRLFAAFTDGGSLSAGAHVPLFFDARNDVVATMNGDTVVNVGGEKVPLALVEGLNIGASDVDGDVRVSGSVVVTPDRVVPNVSLALQGGALTFEPLGIYVDDVGFDLAWTERHAVLSAFTAHSRPRASTLTDIGKKRNITAAGTVLFDDLTPTDVRASIQFEDAWLSATASDRYQVDGVLDLSGKWPNLHLANAPGNPLVLSQGRVTFDAVSWMESGPRVMDPIINVKRPAKERVAVDLTPDVAPEPSVLDDISMALQMDLGRALEVNLAMPFVDEFGAMGAAISRADTVMRLDGALAVSSDGGSVSTTGEVKVLNGEVRLLQSNFTIDEGTVTFIGDAAAEPQLDLAATMTVTGGDVKMKIRGTPSVPDIQLTSDTFPEQSQILTILLTGKSPTELSDQQGTAAAGALAGLMLNSAIGGSRVGSFSLDPDGSIRMVMPNILKNVYGETVIRPMPDVDEDTWQLELEWAVTKELVLDTTMGDVNKTADLFWELRW